MSACIPAPRSPAGYNESDTHGRIYQSLLRGKLTSEMQLSEYLCFSIWQEEVSSTFVFGGTCAIDHELHLNLHFLRIILPLDALQMKKRRKRERKQKKKSKKENVKNR